MQRHELPAESGRALQFLAAVSSFKFQISSAAAAIVLGLLPLCAAITAIAQSAAANPSTASGFAPAAVTLPGLYNPVADSKAVVTAGNARFTVLTPRLIRMEWAADGKFEDHASLVFLNRRLPVPKFTPTVTVTNGQAHSVSFSTDWLRVTYTYVPGESGKFTEKNLSVTFTLNSKEITWHPGMPDTGNLQGTTRTLDEALGSKTKEPLDPGLISRDGWVVVDDSKRALFDGNDFRFDQGAANTWPWVMLRREGDRQDWYFFGYGHDYEAALHDFTLVAGKIPLPPRFAFGAWWSRYWSYSDQELMQLARDFRHNDIPLDVFVIDMDWHKTFHQGWWDKDIDQAGETKGWTGYSWNSVLFPDPGQFLSDLHGMGLKATMNLHPASGIQPWEDAYPAMAKAMGIDPATGKYVPFDITNKKFAMNYLNLVHHPLEKQGVDFWWLDWQQKATTNMPGVNPTWWLNYVHFSDQELQGKRPLLFHRWGGLGNHRYQIGFSGDTISVWESLAFQPWFTATAANVGYAYWSHDIGGHMPGGVDPELYTRWIQFGIYSPILRTHTTKNPNAERRIWAYPEPYSDIMRHMYHERYAMLPYVYTEARGTYDTGVAFLHPLYYDWPEANEAYDMTGEYVFGSQMIVEPVVTPSDKVTGLVQQEVWIPKGEWIEKDSGAHFTGPVKVQRNFSIDQVPVYVRTGAIVPMMPEMKYSNQKPVDPLIVTVYPLKDGEKSSYSLYEDAGDTRGYQTGQFARTEITANSKGTEFTVTIAAPKASYLGMIRERGYELRLPADWPPQSVTVNGRAVSYVPRAGRGGWRYEGNTLTTVITISKLAVTQPVTVKITRSGDLVSQRTELDGFAGSMTRLNAAVYTIRHAWPFSDVPEELMEAAQTGDYISYYPKSTGEKISKFHQLVPQAQAKVEAIAKAGVSEEDKRKLSEAIGEYWNSPDAKAALADYPNKMARAVAEVKDAGVK